MVKSRRIQACKFQEHDFEITHVPKVSPLNVCPTGETFESTVMSKSSSKKLQAGTHKNFENMIQR